MNRPTAITAALIAGIAVSGCATQRGAYADPEQGAPRVGYVVTEHSAALECLGAVIDQQRGPRLLVYVEGIDDRTVPSRFRERRLSKGGEWLVHTALSKLRSDTVAATTERPGRSDANVLVLSGAWTQDDTLVQGETGALFGRKGDIGLDIGVRGRYDFIAADMLSSQGGTVKHASAIGLALNQRDGGAALLVDSGGEQLRFGFSMRHRDGPQLAQRRIIEAAVMVHIAQHFDISYAPCLGAGIQNPQRYRESLAEYEARSTRDRALVMQQGLHRAGAFDGKIDGVWGPASQRALAQFQRQHGLPDNGRLSPVAYALLQQVAGTATPRAKTG